MKERKEVTVTLDSSVSLYDILDCNTPDEVIQAMEEYKQRYQGRKISFGVRSYGYDGGVEVVILETRSETDREYDKRIKAEQKDQERMKAVKAKTDEKERKEYERLKKKFEKKS
jgi:glycogen synthase